MTDSQMTLATRSFQHVKDRGHGPREGGQAAWGCRAVTQPLPKFAALARSGEVKRIAPGDYRASVAPPSGSGAEAVRGEPSA